MTKITSIQFKVVTSNQSGAGTDGDVYLGIGGREFYVDSTADDFEGGLSGGSSRVYVFGTGANNINPTDNDPRSYDLKTETVDQFPVYIRFQPRSRTDNWILERAEVSVNGNRFPRWDTVSVISQLVGIVVGTRSTLFLHIPRLLPSGAEMAAMAEGQEA